MLHRKQTLFTQLWHRSAPSARTRQLTRQFRARESVRGGGGGGEGENLLNGIPALTPSPSISREKIRKGRRRTDGARLKSSLNVAEGRGAQTADADGAGRGPGFPRPVRFYVSPLIAAPTPTRRGRGGGGVSAPPAQNTGSAKRETDLCILGNQSRGRPRGGKGGLGVDKGVSQS